MYSFATKILKLLLFIVNGKMNVINKQKLPNNQPFIIVCTHKSWIDVVCLGIALYPLPVYFMAKKELFQTKLIRKLLENLNAFPVDRENPGPSVLKIPLKLLRQNKVVGIFPSGTRDSEEKALKNGAIHIASKANVPIMPAVYIGPSSIKGLLARKKRTIIIGDCIEVPKLNNDKETVIKAANELISNEFKKLIHTESNLI
ncbi:1-acyl-sn-glycerol-3-phosphate acyltransferase (plasmid) [Priestia aryabhattai]